MKLSWINQIIFMLFHLQCDCACVCFLMWPIYGTFPVIEFFSSSVKNRNHFHNSCILNSELCVFSCIQSALTFFSGTCYYVSETTVRDWSWMNERVGGCHAKPFKYAMLIVTYLMTCLCASLYCVCECVYVCEGVTGGGRICDRYNIPKSPFRLGSHNNSLVTLHPAALAKVWHVQMSCFDACTCIPPSSLKEP